MDNNLVVNRKWHIVDDVVMGGKSSGQISQQDNLVLFHGEISLENGGGFSSIRGSVNTSEKVKHGIEIKCVGDGRLYEIICKSAENQIAYRAPFTTKKGEPVKHMLTPNQFTSSFRGKEVEAKPLPEVELEEIGVILADGKKGEFKLKIESVAIK